MQTSSRLAAGNEFVIVSVISQSQKESSPFHAATPHLRLDCEGGAEFDCGSGAGASPTVIGG